MSIIKKKLNNKEVARYVTNISGPLNRDLGLGYAVMEGLCSDCIKDPKMAELWYKAGAAMNELNDALEKYYE